MRLNGRVNKIHHLLQLDKVAEFWGKSEEGVAQNEKATVVVNLYGGSVNRCGSPDCLSTVW